MAAAGVWTKRFGKCSRYPFPSNSNALLFFCSVFLFFDPSQCIWPEYHSALQTTSEAQMLHIIVENWDSSPPESIASEETVGPPGGRLTPSWRPGVTSPYSPGHGMVWWGGVTSAYLGKLAKQIFGKSWEFGPRRGAGV